jgi:hypothetical protein
MVVGELVRATRVLVDLVPAKLALEREVLSHLVRERTGRPVDLAVVRATRSPNQLFWSRRYSSRSAAENTSVSGTLPATARPHAAEPVPSSQL